ncbi:transposase [Butyrivibrio sp. INlla16]|uniref:transposase n=1 Tax=Butyrivibrio sp. INlla16 TaxID=1520807 RepID=UPI00088E3664|nr:Transposase domain [Butyrivibrio sp. INlla16]
MIPYKQLSLADIYSDCQNKFENDKPAFLSLLENHIDLDEIIPLSFIKHFYASTGRSRKYPLKAMLWALIIQRIFTIPTDQLLLVFLAYSKPLREFCGFTKVPDASKITRFKQDFLDDLQLVFDKLVDITEPICQAIDSAKADMTIFDSSGIEAFVAENNPKYANRIIKQLKAYAKAMGFNKSYDPYKAAYGAMPSHASANPEIKQLYINGHFCYVFKFGIVTNGLGIVRHISFYNKDFFSSHPDIVVEKKSDSPDDDKCVHDAKLLIPTLQDFFSKHPLINPKTFLGDAAFDSALLYKQLLTGDTFGTDKHFSKAYIPLNSRAGIKYPDCKVNADGIPCCPNDDSLPMKSDGKSSKKNGLVRFKFVCPKIKNTYDKSTGKHHRECQCDNPCTNSSCGRMIHIYPEKNLRAYLGTLRGTEEWNNTYKIRTAVERDINHMKDNLCLAGRRTQNEKTLHADLILAGITQLITVVLADKIKHHEYIRSAKPLIA